MENLDLTETIQIDTGITFPHAGQSDASTARGDTIVAEICSEFTEYRAQAEYFKKNGLLRLAHDRDSLPITFSLSEDHALVALRHGTHDGEGWSSFDISPVGQIVTTFDVVQIGDVLYIAAACKPTKDATTHSLFWCTVDVSADGFNFENQAVAQRGGRKGMQWTLIPHDSAPKKRVGGISISSLLCKVVDDGNNENKSFQVTVSTTQHAQTAGSIYNVRTVAIDGRHWTESSFPVAASLLVQTEPLILSQESGVREEGLVSIVKDYAISGRQRGIGQRCAPDGGFYSSFEYKAGELGSLRSAFSHLNIFGFTDVFLAGENGIGFFSWKTVDMMTIDEPILKGIGFKQLVVSEAEDPTQEGQSKLAIFAVSDNDCLYFIQGTRDYSEVKLKYTFEASGFPIRKGVTHLAARFNALHGTNELLYASSEDNALFFLRRTPEGNSWVEDRITRRAIQYIKYDAFVTTIVLTDGNGTALPTNHTVSITADSLHAVANGKSYTFSSQPVNIAPDNTGCILITIPSASKLACSPLRVSIGDGEIGAQDTAAKAYTFSVDPSHRVSRLLSNYDSPDKLRNAKSSSREPLMEGMSSEQLNNAASLIGQYKTAKGNMESPTMNMMSMQQDETINFMSLQQHSNDSDGNWFDKAADGVENFLGDAIEMIKFVAKEGVKFVVEVVDSTVTFVLKIAGKVFKWACKALWSLLEVVGSALDWVLGTDGFSSFLKGLKLAVDPKEIAKTQKGLSDVITQGLHVSSKAMVATKDSLMDAIHDGGEFIKGRYIDDPRVQVRRPSAPSGIGRIINNPYTRLLLKINPLSWVMEALYEEIPGLKLPDLAPLLDKFMAVFTDALEGSGDILQQLWDSILSQIQIVSVDPTMVLEAILNAFKGVFWTFWDTAALIMEKTFDSLAVLMDELAPLLKEEWNIPGLTDTWEDLTGQQFTLLGFMTFLPATIINLWRAVCIVPVPEFGRVDMSSIETRPFYQRGAMFVSNSEEEPLAVVSNTSSLHKGLVTARTVTPGAPDKAVVTTEPISDEKSEAPARNTEAWSTAHWYQVIFEDLGKTYNALWSMHDSIFQSMARPQTHRNLQPEGTDPNAPLSAEMGSIWWALFKNLGKLLQGGALVFSAVITTRNTTDIVSNPIAKGTIALFGGMELAFFFCSLLVPSREEGLSAFADLVGSGGSILRCVDDDEWNIRTVLEMLGSEAVVLGLVAKRCRDMNMASMTKACLVAAGLASAATDLGSNAFALTLCMDGVTK